MNKETEIDSKVEIIHNSKLIAKFDLSHELKFASENWHFSGGMLEIYNFSIESDIDKTELIDAINKHFDNKFQCMHIISYYIDSLRYLDKFSDNKITLSNKDKAYEIKLDTNCPMSAIFMEPFFRHGKMTPWGGEKLKTLFNKNIPDSCTGESLEISTIPGMPSTTVENLSLESLIYKYGEALIGKYINPSEQFPLLIKILDAKDLLSIQVHPDNQYAKTHENGKLGKEEAWVVLDCDENSKLIYGLKKNVDPHALASCLKSGKSPEEFVHYVSVKKGDVLHIKPGTVHALGKGIVVYEIQQTSDVTYRMWDWARRDKNGNLRELHIDDSINCIKYDQDLNITKIPTQNGMHEVLNASPFSLYVINIDGSYSITNNDDTIFLLTSLTECTIKSYDNELNLHNGDSALLPANLDKITIKGKGALLLAKANK